MPRHDAYSFVARLSAFSVTTYRRHHPAVSCQRTNSVSIVDGRLVRTYSHSRKCVCYPSTAFYKGRLGHHCRRNHILENRHHKSHRHRMIDHVVSVGSKLETQFFKKDSIVAQIGVGDMPTSWYLWY